MNLTYGQVRDVVMHRYPSVDWQEISQELSFGVDRVSSHMLFVAMSDDGSRLATHLMDVDDWEKSKVPSGFLLAYVKNKLSEQLRVGVDV